MKKAPINLDPRVIAFAESAQRFCKMFKQRSKLTKRDFVHQCMQMIAELLARFIPLLEVKTRPHVHTPSGETWEELGRRCAKEYHKPRKSIDRKLGKDYLYYEVFNPYEPEKDDPISTSLGGDITDIYNDLKDGVDFYLKGDDKSLHSAVYLWKLNFRIHTTNHCVSALRALRELVTRYHEND